MFIVCVPPADAGAASVKASVPDSGREPAVLQIEIVPYGIGAGAGAGGWGAAGASASAARRGRIVTLGSS